MNDNPKAHSGTGMLTRLHFSQLHLFFCSIVEVSYATLYMEGREGGRNKDWVTRNTKSLQKESLYCGSDLAS